MPAVETRTCASLRPAVGEAARRAGAERIGLVDLVGPTPGLNTHVDRVCVVLDDELVLGDAGSSVHVVGSTRGRVRPPADDVPDVVARVALGDRRADVVDAPEPVLALLAADPATVVEGDPVAGLPDALALVPDDALPVVTTTWSLSALSVPDRLRFVQALDHAATGRTVVWVSLEGVGVAPAVPTFGDRHASGHTIVGVAVFRHGRLDVEAVARCWSRGSVLGWVTER